MRFDDIAMRVAVPHEMGWEAPKGRRKEWRKKNPDGTYEYSDKPPVVKKQQKQVVKKEVKKEDEPPEYNHRVYLTKENLKHTLGKGHFTILSAGRNPNDEKEAKMKPDDPFFHERHKDLQSVLEQLGFKYTEAVGHYGSKEPSFLVFHDEQELTPKTVKSMLIHHAHGEELKARKEALNELGKHFNQDSVLHGSGGNNTISFTTGKNAGKECGGKGWKETPDAEDYYTDIELAKKNHTKFQLNVDGCFKGGFFTASVRTASVSRTVRVMEAHLLEEQAKDSVVAGVVPTKREDRIARVIAREGKMALAVVRSLPRKNYE